MLERLTDTSYEELMRDKVFKPLGMESAGFRAPATNGRVDQPYGHNPNPVDPEPRGDNPRAIAPAGAVHCSIVDLALYVRFHLGHGADEILNEKEIKLLHTPVSQKDGYALGWKITQRDWAKGVAITHAGSNTMFFTVIWIAPKREFAAVAACNIGTPVGRQKCDAAVAHLVRKYLK
jgi:CubicO group peptidase (beta-lactamase class C family)